MGKKAGFLTIFSMILLVLLPLVALVCRLGDNIEPVRCRRAENSAVMLGTDTPGQPRLFLLPGETLNINTATAEELIALPGIGRELSERIVTERSARGGFESIEEIMNVYGIGQKRYEAIAHLIRTGDG